jgi:hypothetical protein
VDIPDLLLQVKRQYGDEYGVVITDPDILQFIYEGEMDIIRNTGGFDSKVLTNQVKDFPVSVPSTIQIIRITINDKPLTYISIPELDLVKSALATTTGSPLYWYNQNNEFVQLYPTDSTDTTPTTIYYKHTPVKRTVATGPLTVPERFHTDLLQYCLARCHNKNRDAQSEQIAMAAYTQNVSLRREEGYSFEGPIYKQADPEDY